MIHKTTSGITIVCLLTLSLVSACVPGQPTPLPPPPATSTPVPPTVAQPKPPPPSQAPPTQPLPTALPEPTAPLPSTEEPSPLPPPPPSVVPPPTGAPVPRPFYEDRSHPATLLSSYVNAINRGEYARAWGYWENPPNPSFVDFRAGFADTAFVLLAIHPPTWYDGAAGSAYAEVPTLLMATHNDASQHNYVGCYVVRSSNVEGAPPGWWLFDATVSPTPGSSADANLLVGACAHPSPGPPEPAYEQFGDPVQLLASYFNAINLKDYARAWDYWENPPNPNFADFQNGYADTDSAFLVVSPPVGYEGAAGSSYAQVPSILLVTHADASQHNFAGCYVASSPNLGPDAGTWSLNDAEVQALPSGAVNAHMLAGACDGH